MLFTDCSDNPEGFDSAIRKGCTSLAEVLVDAVAVSGIRHIIIGGGMANMKRCSIIIHSVTGNCYIIGSYLKDLLCERNVDARLYRVEDPDLHIWAEKQDTTNDFYEDILALPVASVELLHKSDMIILGAPTRFGNMPTASAPQRRAKRTSAGVSYWGPVNNW